MSIRQQRADLGGDIFAANGAQPTNRGGHHGLIPVFEQRPQPFLDRRIAGAANELRHERLVFGRRALKDLQQCRNAFRSSGPRQPVGIDPAPGKIRPFVEKTGDGFLQGQSAKHQRCLGPAPNLALDLVADDVYNWFGHGPLRLRQQGAFRILAGMPVFNPNAPDHHEGDQEECRRQSCKDDP